MRLTDTINKIKFSASNLPDLPKDLFIIGLILLVGIGSFMVGRLSVLHETHKNELKIISTESLSSNSAGVFVGMDGVVPTSAILHKETSAPIGSVPSPQSTGGMYVGSRSGKIFYLPWCSGVKRIHEKNKIWFKDATDAMNKGYKPSSSCKGI